MGLDDVQRVVDRLAADLSRSVVVDDPAVRPLCTSAHYGDEDPVRIRAVLQRDPGPDAVGHVLAQGVAKWQKAGVIPARADIGMHRRLCVPVRHDGELLGLLLVMDADGSLRPQEVAAVEAAAREVAAWMVGGRRAEDAAALARESLVGQLLGPDPRARVAALGALVGEGALPEDEPCAAVVLTVVPGPLPFDTGHARIAVRDALARDRRTAGTVSVWTVEDQRGVLLTLGPGSAPSRLPERAARLVDDVRRAGGQRFGCVAGVGSCVPGAADAWKSHRQAAVAARAATRPGGRPRGLDPDSPVVEWSALGTYATLLQLPDSALDESAVPPPLLALVAADPRGHLVDTLRCFLEHAGSAPATAAALHIHRTSLYYRLDRIRAVTGCDLDDGEARLQLHLGLKLLDLVSPAVE